MLGVADLGRSLRFQSDVFFRTQGAVLALHPFNLRAKNAS
jgi:hypothetical protein